MKCKLVLAAAVAAMASSAVFAAGRTMLAVPARHDMVGFGFDLLRQLPGSLVLACYKGEDRIERLEVFDRTASEWRTITAENWAAGLWRADSLVIAGENKAAADLLALSGWTQQTKMPSDRAKLDVVNAVNSFQPLTEKQWKSLSATYGFKVIKVKQPSPREHLREQARARRAEARAQKEEERAARKATEAQRKALEDAEKARLQEEKAQLEARKAQLKAERETALEAEKAQKKAEENLERQRKLMMRNKPAEQPRMEVVPIPVDAELATPVEVKPVEVKPAPTAKPVEVNSVPTAKPVEVKPVPAQTDRTLAAPFDGSSAIDEMPTALEDAAKLKAAEANAPAVKPSKAKASEEPTIVFKKRESAAVAKVPEAKVSEVKTNVAEAKVKAAVEAAVSEAAAKSPKAETVPAPAPAAVEVRVPAREAVAPKVESSPVPVTIPEATPAKIPETKPAEITVPEVKVPAAKPAEVAAPDVKVPAAKPAEVKAPEVKVPAAKPVEVAAPEVKVPEVKPVKTPEIKVPAIVLDPM